MEERSDRARVLVVDVLFRDERDLSEVAYREWGADVKLQLRREREIAALAIENIVSNVARLVRDPITQIVHLSELAQSESAFSPDAIVLSGTLRDFDFYKPEILEDFARFIMVTQTPVLGICGGHQLVGLGLGARVITCDNQDRDVGRTS